MKIRSVRPEFFSDTRMSSLSPMARILYIGLWCVADDEGRGRYLPKQIEGEVFPHEQVDVYALLAELLSTARIVTYQDGAELYFHIPNFSKYQRPNRSFPSRLPAPPEPTPNGSSAHAVPEQRVSTALAPLVLGSGSKGEGEGVVVAPQARRTPHEAQTDRDGVWTALEDLFGEAAETERKLRGKVVRSLSNVGGSYSEVKARAAAWPKLFPRGDGAPLTLTATALEKWWGQLGLIVETGRPPPDCPICGNRRLVGVTAEGEVVSVEEDHVQVRQCSCVGAK